MNRVLEYKETNQFLRSPFPGELYFNTATKQHYLIIGPGKMDYLMRVLYDNSVVYEIDYYWLTQEPYVRIEV